VSAPGCAAKGMAVPLAVKDLRPLRGAFGVLDREPPARHRQIQGQAREPASASAAQPCIVRLRWHVEERVPVPALFAGGQIQVRTGRKQ
jgi:hypothetical protein